MLSLPQLVRHTGATFDVFLNCPDYRHLDVCGQCCVRRSLGDCLFELEPIWQIRGQMVAKPARFLTPLA